jgi:hypothetical protein
MKRLGIALLMALYVGLAPFALGKEPLTMVTTMLALSLILYLVRRLATAAARG